MQQKIVPVNILKWATLRAKIACFLLVMCLPAVTPGYAAPFDRTPKNLSAIKVSGMITDVNNKPLAGVSVAIKNGKGGVLTDEEGRFFFRCQ